jgi:hypothetical protein
MFPLFRGMLLPVGTYLSSISAVGLSPGLAQAANMRRARLDESIFFIYPSPEIIVFRPSAGNAIEPLLTGIPSCVLHQEEEI